MYMQYGGSISLRFSGNSASSELLQNLEDMFYMYYMYSNVFRGGSNPPQHNTMLHVLKGSIVLLSI